MSLSLSMHIDRLRVCVCTCVYHLLVLILRRTLMPWILANWDWGVKTKEPFLLPNEAEPRSQAGSGT